MMASVSIVHSCESLKQVIIRLFNKLLSGCQSVALLDFPNHDNVGDSAIWVGEKAILKHLKIEVKYQCDLKNYSKDKLLKAHPEGPILIHGGGNFGDVWPAHESLRQRIVQDFPDRKIIQLPQTVFYQEPANREAAARVYSEHKDFTVLVRDRVSLGFIEKDMRLKGMLCPDSAFYLDLKRTNAPTSDVICLMRTDHEGHTSLLKKDASFTVVDWLGDIQWWGVTAVDRLEALRVEFPRRLAFLEDVIKSCYDRLANKRIEYGIKMLSQGKVVVTDRLHAHILCLLCGIPHVLIDNSYGKLSTFYETWTKDSEITFWAKSFEEGVGVARRLIADNIV